MSWRAAPRPDETPLPPAPPEPKVVRIKADLTLVDAAKNFLDTWFIRKDYDAAFRYLSTSSYACYDLVRGPDAPASTSPDDAGQKIRASLERVGQWVGTPRELGTILEAAEPRHPSIRVMDQPYSRMFSLTSFPTALGDVVECDARARGVVPARSPAARIRRSLRHDAPFSHPERRRAGPPSAMAKGRRRLARQGV